MPWYWTMLVSPSDPNVLVLGTSKGLYRSADGGKSWAATGPEGHPRDEHRAGGRLDRRRRRAHDEPEPGRPEGRRAHRARRPGRRSPSSTDDGKTWKELHPRGLPDVTVQALATDPKDGKTVYALLNNGKLYRSTDGAASFKLVSPSLGIAPWAIAVTQRRPLRQRRHGQRLAREHEREGLEDDAVHGLERRPDGDGVRRPAGRLEADPHVERRDHGVGRRRQDLAASR